MALLLDAGAWIAFERGDRGLVAIVDQAQVDGVPIRTTSAVVAQVWRGSARQAKVSLLLRGTDERSLDHAAARRIGTLLGVSGLADVVDGSIVDIAVNGDEILTSDPGDIGALAAAAGKQLKVTPIS